MYNISLFNLPRGFDRDLNLLLFSMAARRVAMGFLQVVRAIYFALLGFSPFTIGLLLSVATVVSAFHHISFGVLSDRYGRKPFLLLGTIFATCRLVIFATTRNFWLIAFGQGLGAMGEGAGAGQPVVSGYITDKVDVKKRVSVFSTLAITNAFAASLGSMMAGLPQLFQNLIGVDLVSAHVPLFLIGVIFSVLSFIFLLPISDVAPVEEEKFKEDQRALKIKSWGVILKFSLVRSTSGLGWGLIESLLTLYFFIRFATGSDVLGLIFAAARLTSILTYLLVPFIVAKFSEIRTLTLSRILSACVTVTLVLTNRYFLAAVLLIILWLLLMFTAPIRQSFATGIVDPDETATAIGISNFARMGVRSV
ncbi:MAG: MFS transporter, partial [Candidatus Hodarchaeota archaeon]